MLQSLLTPQSTFTALLIRETGAMETQYKEATITKEEVSRYIHIKLGEKNIANSNVVLLKTFLFIIGKFGNKVKN